MEETNKLQLKLKQDWDSFPHYQKSQGHFVGRIQEKTEVINWIVRREKGCFLVSGERGVGKTALVYEALHEAIKLKNNIIPVLINSSQLVLEESIEESRDKNNPDPYKINPAKLQEKIIINLIRRLYAEGVKRFKDEKIISELGTLYRKAIAEKSEIKEEQKEKREIETEEKIESEVTETLKFDPNHVKYLVGLLGALSYPLILSQKSFFGNFSWNIFFGSLVMLLPLSVYFKISHSTFKKKIHGVSSTVEELYITDKSISNLEYDLYSLLENIKNKHKVVFVIDEMDKIEENINVVTIIKTFKNLFTLSSGIFIFITADKIYFQVDQDRGSRGIAYTLFNDKIFLSRPDFKDLESYLSEILFEPPNDVSSSKSFRHFRNLLCYQAKSDFFELHFKIRDYINGFNAENRPILEVPQLSQADLLEANLQKALGQIYDLNKYRKPSDWVKKEILLKEMYKFIDIEYSRKFEIRQSAPIENDPTAIRVYDAQVNLIDYLLRLGYIYNKQTISKNIEGKAVPFYTYDLTGKVSDIGKAPENPLDYEENFLSQLRKFSKLVNSIEQLTYFQNQNGKRVDPTKILDNGMKQYCDLEVLSIYQENDTYRNKIEKRIPEHISREELEAQTQKLNIVINQLYGQVITILERLLKNFVSINNFSMAKLASDGNLFGSTMALIREGVISSKLPEICFFRKIPKYYRQILVVKDIPVELYDNNKVLINDNARQYLIINLNSKGTFYNLEYLDNKPEGKIQGFLDISISESLQSLDLVIDEIKNHDRDMTKAEMQNFLSQAINNDSLKAYTEWKFSSIPLAENSHKQLLNDLNGDKYKTLRDINSAVEKAKPAVDAFAKQKPIVFESGTDYITKSLGFVDDAFLAKHPFLPDTKDMINELRHLVKGKPSRVKPSPTDIPNSEN